MLFHFLVALLEHLLLNVHVVDLYYHLMYQVFLQLLLSVWILHHRNIRHDQGIVHMIAV
jgi:hypothetical protein